MKSIPRWLRFAILAVAVFSAVAVARDARAALIFTINLDQDGNPTDPAVQISITENAGALDYIVSIVPNPNNIGDLRGSFIDIALMGGLLPAGLSVTGADVTDVDFDTSNTGGGRSPCRWSRARRSPFASPASGQQAVPETTR